MGAADGPKYCWLGTFNALLSNHGTFQNILGTTGVVTANLDCDPTNLYYRQCIINNQLSVVLIVIGAIVFVCCCTCICFYCGCCKCFNNAGDPSPWGCCNRYCPSAPCADPPEKEEVLPEHLVNPKSEEEQQSSLFGSNKKLNSVKAGGLSDLKKPKSPLAAVGEEEGAFASANPIRSLPPLLLAPRPLFLPLLRALVLFQARVHQLCLPPPLRRGPLWP